MGVESNYAVQEERVLRLAENEKARQQTAIWLKHVTKEIFRST